MSRLLLWSTLLLFLFSFTNPRQYSFKDLRDGQEYKFTTIGHLAVMTENLAFDTEGALCYQSADHFCDHYGKLYNFQTAVANKKDICPEGWRIPNTEEWTYLLRGLNGKALAKNNHFLSFLVPENLLNLQFSGFKSHNENRYYQLGQRGFYMSSSIDNDKWTTLEVKRKGKADYIALHNKTPKGRAISCRCIREK